MTLTMKHISKYFSGKDNLVLDNVDFSLRPGEICALIGENGAGKSTLMNILGGVLQPNGGSVELDGRPVHFAAPSDSLNAGIGFIHQELSLINHLTIYENMFLSSLPKKRLFLDVALMKQRTSELFDRLKLDLDPSLPVSSLDSSYKQIVEICRALMQNASLIIMDEPTSSLTEPEIRRIFDIMRTLKEQGVSIIFISHKLGEVMEICDSYCVLRNGRIAASGKIADTDVRQLAAHMVGHEIADDAYVCDSSPGEEVLRLEHLSDGIHFRDISLSVRAGEVLGVTGLLGDGRSELFQTVFGAMGGRYTGRILLDGKEIHPTDTFHSLDRGIAYLPRNRKENAIIGDMSVLDNGTITVLEKLKKGPFIDFARRRALFEEQRRSLHIKTGSIDNLITALSGGNQQKVVLSKWLMGCPKLLILDNPTQGVDIGAKEEIYATINRLARGGTAIIVLSSETREIIRLCSRSLVLFHGSIVGEVSGSDMTEQQLMYLAAGGGNETESA